MSFSAYWSARFADLSDPAVPIDNPSEAPDLPDVPDTTDLANVTVVTDDEEQEAPIVQGESPLPETLPILPVLGLVVFPQTAIPLTIAQPRSIRLIDSVAAGSGW